MENEIKVKHNEIVFGLTKLVELKFTRFKNQTGPEDASTFMFALPTADAEKLLESVKEKLDLGDDERVALNTAYICPVQIMTADSILLYTALEIAEKQYDCHNEQVSGAWRIDGEDFCKEYGLDYTLAREKEDEDINDDVRQEVQAKKALLESQIGTLTSEQEYKIERDAEEEIVEWHEGLYFWSAVIQQIKSKIEEEEHESK